MKLILLLGVVASAKGQLVDNFTCPDEFPGFFPHLISCDKYWYCEEGIAELKTCGNGLGFVDTDDSFTLEQCAELHLVECGERTEIEPPISTENCPRLFGTYPDPRDCGIFWVCQDGKANRYDCPPGLAYDKESRGCRWADEVADCSSNVVTVDEEGSEFQCPKQFAAGVFTKHPHPADCRQYFLCIGGVPREYGCPLGTVFNIGTGSGVDGKCSDPEEVPECAQYYGDLTFDSNELTKNGFNSGSISSENTQTKDSREEVSRPSPPAPKAIVDTEVGTTAAPTFQTLKFTNRFQPTEASTTTEVPTTTVETPGPTATGLPDPVKASPGPNGEEYFYYYYYDEEEPSEEITNEE